MSVEDRLTEATLLESARNRPVRVVVPGASNEEAMEALALTREDGVVEGGILLGAPERIREVAARVGLDLGNFEIRETSDDHESALLAARLVAEGHGDFLLKGQVDTRLYLKAVLDRDLGLVQPGRILSHVTVAHVPTYHKILVFTDVAIAIEPTVEDKVHLVRNAVEIARRLGIGRPKVAMIAAVEKVNPKIRSTVDADAIVQLARGGAFPDAVVEGPYDLYIATSAEAARVKGARGEVCGDADILVFPELNTGNVFYKTLQRFVPGSWNAGVVAGAKVPILLPSRADSAVSKRMSLLVAAFLANRPA